MNMLATAIHLHALGFATQADVDREQAIADIVADLRDDMTADEKHAMQARLTEATQMRCPRFIENTEAIRLGLTRAAA